MSEPPDGDYALHGPVGIESLQQGARLAGLAGGVLLIMAALMAWLGTSLTGLDSYWLAWAAVPACLAAFGGPYLARQLLSRHFLVRWRVLLLVVMSLNTTAWTYAAVVAVAGGPGMELMLVFALLAQACALLPMLFWRFGLLLQLAVQLMATMVPAVYPEFVFVDFVLPLGLWGVLAMLALAAAVYAHRVDLGKADSYYMRYELSELQHQLRDGQEHGRQMESRDTGSRRGGEPSQERISGDHESRNPNPDERYIADSRDAAREPTRSGTAEDGRYRAEFVAPSAAHHQRHPRFRQGRVRQAGAGID
jgi:hypothetical protein